MSTLAAVPMRPTSLSVIPHSLKFGPSCRWSLPWLLATERIPQCWVGITEGGDQSEDLNRVCSVWGGGSTPMSSGANGLSPPHILPCCPSTEAPGEGTAQVNKQVEIWNLSPLQEPPPTRRPLQGPLAVG